MALRPPAGDLKSLAMARLWKLAALAALLVTSLAMTAAPASAAPISDHEAGMPMKHCPDPVGNPDKKGGIPECAMACASALPAMEARPDEAPIVVCGPDIPWTAERLRGLHPETDTPPPKRS